MEESLRLSVSPWTAASVRHGGVTPGKSRDSAALDHVTGAQVTWLMVVAVLSEGLSTVRCVRSEWSMERLSSGGGQTFFCRLWM